MYDTLRYNISTSTSSTNGFILKLSNEDVNTGLINLYAANTHTVFYPKFVAYIQDYTYTASANIVAERIIHITI
jgi:hypothetical protein